MSSHVFIPGSFDPLHLGHLDVIVEADLLFDSVTVGVLYNREKPAGTFSPDERSGLIRAAVADAGIGDGRVDVVTSTALAVDAARDAGADFILKGLRTAADYEIEQQMAHTNLAVSGVRTVFIPCRPEHGFISSRFVREIAAQGGDISQLVSPSVAVALRAKFGAG